MANVIQDFLQIIRIAFERGHLTPRSLVSGAALALLIRLVFKRPKPRYISNLEQVGRRVGLNTTARDEKWEYDIIIVGGGTSGCALASRLSEDPNIRVLLLEAGGSGRALSDSRTPIGYGGLFFTKHVYPFRTEPQAAANGKEKFWPRAKMLGGCSSINAQMAQYGAPGDFDQWASYAGDKSWAWSNFSRYFTKFEKYNPHPDYPLVDATVRGSSGPVNVGYFNTVTNASKAFVKACVGVNIPFTPDFNGPNGTLGASRIMTYVDKKYRRVSSETAYLTPEVLARKNLTVAVNATVTRVLFETSEAGVPRAVGVEFANSDARPRYQARAEKEVILSGGAIHSPHILLISGIGPAAQLERRGIQVIRDLPGVGQNLVDHPVVDMYFKDKLNNSAKYLRPKSFWDVVKLTSAIVQYHILGIGGPLAMNFGESAAFIRSDDPDVFPTRYFPEKLLDSTSAKDSPDLELFSTAFAYKEHGRVFFDVHTFALHVYLLRPTSTGAVLLKSSNPWELPSVNPNYISTEEDIKKLIRGVRLCLQIAQTQPLAALLDHEFTRADLDHELHLKSDVELEAVIRERVETVYHPTTTCRMGPDPEKGDVVDAGLRVYGVVGLRVCDASIFPFIVSGHTAGACYAIAEKLADDIKAEYSSA
ncbi:uncharacterized protein LACBIDRAFT_296999 [Laccaria bicolor S238N-H82]|uniref:pyranose dehydrogenase (acceptor) n=1 Tax=Laccaria bicolor (strain S238N-H82 / ATCC MYA-4686) TaxID=486041 RepID=B0D9R6_LACBS|nr:uncharacterized protein LACBIDRAFT_296999 [Laccaria bicolor S238N-H82]EDR08397.1 predicted protein [Laccaria bicolor S238N-H82]|eukprot:XP_001880622.1 predicted protein [Laccaria bicolor S238N-H82]